MVDFDEVMGVNDCVVLFIVNKIMYCCLNEMYMWNGVIFIDLDIIYIDEGVVIGLDIVIEVGVIIKGKIVIGEDCLIGVYLEIVDSYIGN